MSKNSTRACATFALLLLAILTPSLLAAPQTSGGSGYHLVKKVKLGGAGGWDYLEVDPATHRLFISRSTHVMVFDPGSEKVVGDIPNTEGVHGIALAADLSKGFTSNGRAANSTIFDLASLKQVG